MTYPSIHGLRHRIRIDYHSPLALVRRRWRLVRIPACYLVRKRSCAERGVHVNLHVDEDEERRKLRAYKTQMGSLARGITAVRYDIVLFSGYRIRLPLTLM